MKPEAQRIAIAEACGWTRPEWKYGMYEWNNPDGVNVPISAFPDYLNDLNAMHEAEKMLNDDQQWEWANQIQWTLPKEQHFKALVFRIGTATAAQRAEAYLKTIGKWKP